jgi:hypothetical protein
MRDSLRTQLLSQALAAFWVRIRVRPRCWQVASVLLLSSVTLAADTISGYVLDAQSNERLADVEVAFLVSGDAGAAEMVRHNTDAEGEFSFSGPFLTAGTAFTLVAHYGGLEYATDPLTVGAQDQVIIEVFDATEDASQIRVEGHHLFLSLTEAGIDVAQMVHFDNLGASTYMGERAGGGRRVLQLQVPPGNLALQGHSGEVLRASPTRLFTATPMPPGRSQVAFTVQLPGEGFGGVYEHETLYPTKRLELFVQPSNVELPAPLFQDLGEIQLHDQGYRHYRVTDLSPGRKVLVPLPYSQPLRWALKWGMLAFVLVTFAAVILITRPTAAPPTPASLSDEREMLIRQLAQLDDRIAAASGVDADDLQQQRAKLKERVADLYRQLA